MDLTIRKGLVHGLRDLRCFITRLGRSNRSTPPTMTRDGRLDNEVTRRSQVNIVRVVLEKAATKNVSYQVAIVNVVDIITFLSNHVVVSSFVYGHVESFQ
jgi:hypothetical protein